MFNVYRQVDESWRKRSPRQFRGSWLFTFFPCDSRETKWSAINLDRFSSWLRGDTGHGVVDTSNVQLARTLIYLLVQVRCYFTFPKLKILPTCLEDFARNQNYNFLNGNIGRIFNEETVLAQPWYSDRYSRTNIQRINYLLFRKRKISGSCCLFVIEQVR